MDNSWQVLWEDSERVFCREWRANPGSDANTVLTVVLGAEHPTALSLDCITHEFGLKDELNREWAVRPLEVRRERGRTMLVLEDPGGEPLARRLGEPMGIGAFLPLAIDIAKAVGKLHQHGLVHKDLKPANIFVNCRDGQVRLTGFGIASRLPRERQAPAPPESIAGTLAYMAPEQTGRMNRSIDARSDLYALGVTLYQMLTGALPFVASEPMEWVHCHIARKPVPPHERLQVVPDAISKIVMRLLAKSPEERYQTAAGVRRDLDRCLKQWEAWRRIEKFPLGERDIPDRLLIPEKLYGREREAGILLAAFDRVVKSGVPELVLVSGHSGIGKSSVVHELHKVLVPPRGLFASGKFDQYKRDIPYATLVQAFRSLVRPLLGRSDAELAKWRRDLLDALGPNGQLMVDLIPELQLVIGEQSPVPELPPQQSQGRFHLVFEHFIGVFARPEHPLALFLDDLQWLDAATLDLLEDLLARSNVTQLLVIGAYRDNEVDITHPLKRKLESIEIAGGRVEEIKLEPISQEDVGQLVVDALRCEPARAAPLTLLLYEKTGGNPFFVIQFLYALADERLLALDHGSSHWKWDLERIRAKGYADNVVDLMVGKLGRLPTDTQTALQLLACLGSAAETTILSVVLESSVTWAQAALWEAVRQGLVERLNSSYRFVHDRVQEAAYSLIPEEARAARHLRVGRLLLAWTPSHQREEAIFEIVNQLNRGAALITDREEREQLAELNLIAGGRAKVATAYASALTYLTVATTFLAEDCWKRRHKLIFALELGRAECEILTGKLTEADQRLEALLAHAESIVEQAAVVSLYIDLHTTLGQNAQAIAVGLDCLQRHLGIDWPSHPTEEEARQEYDRIWSQLGSRSIEQLVDLPVMTDPASLAMVDVLTKVFAAAMYTEANLACLLICRTVNLSLARGNCDASTFAYAMLGAVAGATFGDYKAGFRFGQLGCALVEQRRLQRFQARVYNQFGTHVLPWTQHVRAGRDLLSRAFEVANKNGDLTFSAYSCHALITNLLAAGDPLSEVQRQVEHGLAVAERTRFRVAIDLITIQLGLVRTLRGLTPKFGSFSDSQLDELQLERRLVGNAGLERAEFSYWTRKMQVRFLAGDYASAVDAATQAQSLLWIVRFAVEATEFHLYAALSHAAFCDSIAPDQHASHLGTLTVHYRQLLAFAANCPENFEHRAALVGAEMARLERRELDAERLYEQAIRAARSNGFIHNEALAYELAARFYAARGFEEFARVYLQNARDGYLRWGAVGKVRQLDLLYPHLQQPERESVATGTIALPVERLDLETVIKLSQAVSGTMVRERLLIAVMRTAIAYAGAERSLLTLSHGLEQRIVAEATTGGDMVDVQLRDDSVTAGTMAESILQYVLRTREVLILDNALTQAPFAEDPYIRQSQSRSILCLPLINQAKLVGVLYLENNLIRGAFAPARTAVMKLLASQSAIALENTRLYRDLAEREARSRRLVQANIIGIFIWESGGRIIEANDIFLRILGYDRDDLVGTLARWRGHTPPEWRGRDLQAAEELRRTGRVQPFEKEYFRKDGSRVAVLVGGARLEGDERKGTGVAFVLDLTERKRAEAQARESEGRLREMQMELAHANRVATMGQLTASIAHEVNQPIAATVANAQAALRWLNAQSPNLEEGRQALARIVKDGERAGAVITRIRDLIKKAPPRKDLFAINDAIQEVIDLTRGEASKVGVSVEAELADGLPLIEGDRVQLQQVILNLILNAVEALRDVTKGVRELVVSTRKAEPASVLVAVRDTGPGLAPEIREHLFDAFYTTKPEGLGLGLSICRSIIEAHGGHLWADTSVQFGSVFQFSILAHAVQSSMV